MSFKKYQRVNQALVLKDQARYLKKGINQMCVKWEVLFLNAILAISYTGLDSKYIPTGPKIKVL